MDAEENRRPVSRRAHSPWKSPKARFPHFHRRDDAVEKWKAKNQASHFPTARVSLSQKSTQKGGLEAGRFAPSSRLILQ